MILCICEKPAQARDIARNLKANRRKEGYLEGDHYIVTWCIGHLLELAPPEYYKSDIKPWHIDKLPLIPKEWKLLVSSRTKKQFNIIKQLLKKTQHVIIASDPDREGESIVREILEICHYRGKIERLWLNALDEKSIQKAFSQLRPGHITEQLYEAAKARSYSDWLLGMNATMAMSSLYGVNTVLSVGRVQTPTLRLVVDRDRLIENFKSQDYFILKIQFSTGKSQFWTTWRTPESDLNENGYCLNRELVESVAAKVDDEPGTVQRFTESKKTQKAPICFSLSTLQKIAASQFGYSAKRTLEIAQSLYEKHKATTYPRTDNGYLPEEQLEEVNAVLSALSKADHGIRLLVKACDPYFKSQAWNNKKVTAHHGIIPTLNDKVNINKMSQEEFNLYDLIRRQYLAQFLGDYEYLQRQIEVLCASERFTAIGNTPIKLGWKQIINIHNETENDNDNISDETIPHLNKGETVENQETKVEAKQTKPPAHFNEGTLIQAMKTVENLTQNKVLKKILKNSSGIGTEATRANILETLFNRKYLQRKNKKVISTDKGRALIDIVPSILKDPILTAQWEQQLESIINGQGNLITFINSQVELLKSFLDELRMRPIENAVAMLQLKSETQNRKVYLCPKCRSPLRRLTNKKQNYFWGCTQYPVCDFTTYEKHEKPNYSG